MLRATLFAASALAVAGHGDAAAEPVDLRAPEEGGPRRFSVAAPDGLSIHRSPSSDGAVVKRLSDGAVVVNLDCTEGVDHTWCAVEPLHGGARGYAVADFLWPARGPDGIVPVGPDDSRRRARSRDFDARGRVACAQERGEALGECTADVARSGGGDASVVVTFANGFARTLYFTHGEFISASATMSGVGRDTDWRSENATYFIRVDDQRYELPHALVFGN